jgi:hypothetical protein
VVDHYQSIQTSNAAPVTKMAGALFYPVASVLLPMIAKIAVEWLPWQNIT